MNAQELLKQGGAWLRVAREWLKANKHNGSRVTWGSREVIEPHMTARDVEDLASHVAISFQEVVDAARKVAGQSYGIAVASCCRLDGTNFPDCVLVLQEDWEALRKLVHHGT